MRARERFFTAACRLLWVSMGDGPANTHFHLERYELGVADVALRITTFVILHHILRFHSDKKLGLEDSLVVFVD